MLRAVMLKEGVKLRAGWLALLAGNAAVMVYVFIETRLLFRLDHAEMVWYRVMHLGQIHFEPLRYVPAGAGLVLAAMQFLPEMRDGRLRLSLHLPAAPHAIVLAPSAGGALGPWG